MATEVKRTRGPGRRVPAVFINKTEIANHLGIGNMDTIDAWIGKGKFPPPHSQPGDRYTVWLRKHWDAYVAHGRWPKEAWPEWKS